MSYVHVQLFVHYLKTFDAVNLFSFRTNVISLVTTFLRLSGVNQRSVASSRSAMLGKQTKTRSASASQESLSIDDKLNLLINDVGEIKADNKHFRDEIADIKKDLKTLKKDINKSLDMCFSDIEECKTNISQNTSALSSCEQDIDGLRSENIQLKRSVEEFKRRVNVAEQYSRSNCLEITGVPEQQNENMMFLLRKIAAAMNFRLEDSMVDAVHRLAKNPNKPAEPRGIIVKFCRRLDMEEMRSRARVKRSLSAAELGFTSEGRVYVNLSLSRETRILWAAVQHFKKQNNFKYSWITSAGKIFIRKEQGQPAIHVAEVLDLERI